MNSEEERSSANAPDLSKPELPWADETYDLLVKEAIGMSIANSTKRAYATGQSSYESFCSLQGIGMFPVTEDKLCKWAVRTWKFRQIDGKTINAYLSAIDSPCDFNLQQVFDREKMPILKAVIRGISTDYAETNYPNPKERHPITPALLERMISKLKPSDAVSWFTAIYGRMSTWQRTWASMVGQSRQK